MNVLKVSHLLQITLYISWHTFLESVEVLQCLAHIAKLFVTFFFHQHAENWTGMLCIPVFYCVYAGSALETHIEELSIVEFLANFVKYLYHLW